MAIQLNSPGWQVARPTRSAAARPSLPGLPPEFLAPGAQLAGEAIVQPARASRGRAATGGALDMTVSVDPGHTAILAIRHPSGALTFTLPIQATSRSARGASDVRFQLPMRQARTRGLADQVIKAIVVKVAKVAADKAVSYVLPRLAEALERDLWRRRGLHEGWVKVTPETLAAAALRPETPVAPGRSLLLLHGSFSDAATTFRPLADGDFFSAVRGTYEDRIYAFNCLSIARTPEENARLLLESLPAQEIRFDVVTHGIGGLVLRHLVERERKKGPTGKRLALGHAVLVAAPNGGTPLASAERWDGTLGWLANLLELFPDNPFTSGAALVANGLTWLANHALGDLPGLRAMDPADDSLAALEDPPKSALAAYSALAASYEPAGGITQRLLDAGLDGFFGGPNDLVMPTEGSWRLARGGRRSIPSGRIGCFGPGGNLRGEAVTHLNLLAQPPAVTFMVNALLGREQPLGAVDLRTPSRRSRWLRGGTDAPAAAPGADLPAGAAGGADEQPAIPPLHITVVNADLSFEREALLLGHYQATRLTGTEKVVDGLIGGTMSRSLAMRVYPEGVGSHQIFINNRPTVERGSFLPMPRAVIVAGLGEEGKLRASDIAQSVRQAVIAWSQRLAERKHGRTESFELASTLLGSGGTGVSTAEAARLVAEGVYQANEFLAMDGGTSPRVGQLRFIELYLDRATDAWRALRLQAEVRPERYTIADVVKVGSGALTRHPELGYRGAEYDFITVEGTRDADGTPLIAYKLDTRRARSEVRGQRAQSALIRELVSTGSSDKNTDDRIGRTLFNLVIPMEIEAYLAGSGEMQIELDPQTASIPWELLDPKRDDSELPWAIRVKLLRKLRIRKFRERVNDAGVDGGVLVIGEPQCPDDYPRLYAARNEALAVRAALAPPGSPDEDRLLALISEDAADFGPSATEVVNALFDRPWRVVHVAGHGIPGKGGKPGGVVLSNGTFLGPAEINNMRTVPELVFVNCCHLGAADARQLLSTRYDRATFASGLAGALIGLGVRCVVAAGWAVDDDGARVFAEAFYAALVRGDRFIDAVSHARRETYFHDPGQNTWAAYQCYGDPDWMLRQVPPDANAAAAPAVDEFSGIASALSLKFALDRILVQVRFQGADPRAALAKLQYLEAQHGKTWGAQGDVAELFGMTFAEAGDSEAGLRWYRTAVTAADGRASMRAIEQLVNVGGRMAWEIVDRAARHASAMKGRSDVKGARSRAAAALTSAIERAEGLLADALAQIAKVSAIHPTLERASLTGSIHKRRALVNLTAGRRTQADRDMRLMRASYAEAQAIGEKAGSTGVFYPAANCLVADVALNAGRGRWRTLDADRLAIVRRSLEADEPDFWTVVGRVDLDLYEAMARRRLKTAGPRLAKGYADLYRRVKSTRLWGSVYDTACLTLPAYAGRAAAAEKEAASALLAQLQSYAHPPPA
jgi:hypothetical protein